MRKSLISRQIYILEKKTKKKSFSEKKRPLLVYLHIYVSAVIFCLHILEVCIYDVTTEYLLQPALYIFVRHVIQVGCDV